MSFADDLKKTAESVKLQDNASSKIKNLIDCNVRAIVISCKEAAQYGRKEIDGFVRCNLYGDERFTKGIPDQFVPDDLFAGLTRDEEEKIIAGIQEKISQLGFCNFEIKSYRPEKLKAGSKSTGWGVFKPIEYVTVYRPYRSTDGFCVKVHVKW